MARGGLPVKTSNTDGLWGADGNILTKWYTTVMIEFTERVSVPDKCKNCAMMAQFAMEHDTASAYVDELTEAGLSGSIRDGLIRIAMTEDGMTQEDATERIDRHQALINNETSKTLDELDDVRDAQVTLAQLALSHCNGQLKLEGQRDGEHVTAYFCMSKVQPDDSDMPNSEIVTVERDYTKADEDYEA